MGRGSSGAGKGAARTSARHQRAEQEAERRASAAPRRVNNDILREAIEKIPASKFTQYEQPDTINVGGVNFTRINSTEQGGRFISFYQASEQASNGEYPTFDVVVERQRNRAKPRYVFGFGGTRLT